MPIYRALGLRTSVRISDLAGTVSTTPQRGRTKENTAITEQTEKTLASGETLHEHVTMDYIGEFPLMMAHIGSDIYRPSGDHLPEAVQLALKKLKVDVSKSPFLTPKALAIEIKVPRKLFKLKPVRGRDHNDVKVEIFYNGQLAESLIVLGKIDQDVTELVSGRRIGLISARPWVLVPEKQNADGTLHDVATKNTKIAAEDRWSKVQYALKREAELRELDAEGHPSPCRAYISALTDLKLPENIIEKVQKGNLARFGVIDIVFMLGDGHKSSRRDGLQYLFAPFRVPSGNRRAQMTQNETNTYTETVNEEDDAQTSFATQELTPPSSIAEEPTSAASEKKFKGATLRPVQSTKHDPVPQLRHHQFDWPTPELSQNSVCSYAQSVPSTTSLPSHNTTISGRAKSSGAASSFSMDPGQTHVFRMIKSMRNAEFEESEMVFAVRYIVG